MIPALDRQTSMVALTIAVCATVALTAVSPAHAASARDPKFQHNLEATVRYLQNAQLENGGFAEPGTEPGSDFTAWVTLALAAAGINPRDQTTAPQHWVGGHSAYTYLAENAHNASLTTDFERELLVVDAAGTSPHDFGGVDLAGEILKRQIATGPNVGAFPHEAKDPRTPGVNDTIFAILALSPIHEPAVEEAISRATQWLETQQKCDGSWNWSYTPRISSCNPKERQLLPGEAEGEIDMTAAALEALNAIKHPDPEGQKLAFEYLRESETANGGFVESLTESEPNVASTAWTVQAMWSAGINPEEWLTHKVLATEEPLGYLASMQQEDGHIRYRTGEELNGMWMTAYVTPAFTGNPLPIPAVPYEEPPLEPPGSGASGNGGESPHEGGGVISGGGGDGAKLFSRPQAGSKGHTPGGARQRKSRKHERPATHRLNPGPARKTPVPTATTDSTHHAKKHNDHNQPSRRGTGGMALNGTDTGGGGQSSGREVKGLLIGSQTDALEPGAPGLRGAEAGENQTSWLAIGIAAAALALALGGALVELSVRG
jgi:Prenyltransferase and squalene oxidase repeat